MFLILSFLFLFFQNVEASQPVDQARILQIARAIAQVNIVNVDTVKDVENSVILFKYDLPDIYKDIELSKKLVDEAIDEYRKILVYAKMEQWFAEIDNIPLSMQEKELIQLPIQEATRLKAMISEEIEKFRTSYGIPKGVEIYKKFLQRFEQRLKARLLFDYGQLSRNSRIQQLSTPEQQELDEMIAQDCSELAELKKIETLKHDLRELIMQKINSWTVVPLIFEKDSFKAALFENVSSQKIPEEKKVQLKTYAEQQLEKALKKKFPFAVDTRKLILNSEKEVIEIPERDIPKIIGKFIDDEIKKLSGNVSEQLRNDFYYSVNKFLQRLAIDPERSYQDLFEYSYPIVMSKLQAKIDKGELKLV